MPWFQFAASILRVNTYTLRKCHFCPNADMLSLCRKPNSVFPVNIRKPAVEYRDLEVYLQLKSWLYGPPTSHVKWLFRFPGECTSQLCGCSLSCAVRPREVLVPLVFYCVRTGLKSTGQRARFTWPTKKNNWQENYSVLLRGGCAVSRAPVLFQLLCVGSIALLVLLSKCRVCSTSCCTASA